MWCSPSISTVQKTLNGDEGVTLSFDSLWLLDHPEEQSPFDHENEGNKQPVPFINHVDVQTPECLNLNSDIKFVTLEQLCKNVTIRSEHLAGFGIKLNIEDPLTDSGKDDYFMVIYALLKTFDPSLHGVYSATQLKEFLKNGSLNSRAQIVNEIRALISLKERLQEFSQDESCLEMRRYLAILLFRACWRDNEFTRVSQRPETHYKSSGISTRRIESFSQLRLENPLWKFFKHDALKVYPSVTFGRKSALKTEARDSDEGKFIYPESMKKISHFHSFLKYQTGKGWMLQDLGSSNSTYFPLENNKSYTLRSGDLFLFGEQNLLKLDEATVDPQCTSEDCSSLKLVEPKSTNHMLEKSGYDKYGNPTFIIHVLGGPMRKSAFRNYNSLRKMTLTDVTLGRKETTWKFNDRSVKDCHASIRFISDACWVLTPHATTWFSCHHFKEFRNLEISEPVQLSPSTTEIKVGSEVLPLEFPFV